MQVRHFDQHRHAGDDEHELQDAVVVGWRPGRHRRWCRSPRRTRAPLSTAIPRSLQPEKHPRPLTRREVPAIPPSPGACFHARSLQPEKHPRPLTRREVPAIPPSPGACFHARSLQPGKHPRPLTRREVPAIPPSLGRASMQVGQAPILDAAGEAVNAGTHLSGQSSCGAAILPLKGGALSAGKREGPPLAREDQKIARSPEKGTLPVL